MFTAGLIEILRVDVEMQNPPNLVTAMNLAKAFERKMQLNRGNFSVGCPVPSWTALKPSTINTFNTQKPGMGNTSRPTTSMVSSASTPPIKRLGRAEMAERRAKGQCFNCDDLYSVGHKCKRLVCLLMDDLEHEEETEGSYEPEISLHAITGIRNSQTMQLQAHVAGPPMLILVDSGSTHNFVNKQVALHLKLPVTVKLGLQLTVANGEKKERKSVPYCQCGEVAILRPSWTTANPGRRFFGCKHYGTTEASCGYFLWSDEDAPEHYRNVMNGLLKNLKEKDAIIESQKKSIADGGKTMKKDGVWMNYTLALMLGVTFGIWWKNS
ncbi:uncharacterized protein [Euphorbia lathyris]|uniref:uncharacterized protein n=1 Tax=Euphorbia lathyris TaxID=212925 RepID=UPI0033140029